MQFVSGSFDTKEDKLVLVSNTNYGKVFLCLKDHENGNNVLIGEIRLSDSGLLKDFKATLEDAKKFGKEICRRFNEFPQDEKL